MLFILLLVACAGMPPKTDFAQAKIAVASAKINGAGTLSPLIFKKSVKYLEQSERAYHERIYSEARKFAVLAREYAEKAEVEALEKKSKE